MITRFANPRRFLKFADRAMPIAATAAAVLLTAGLYMSLISSPPDYQQGESVRIMYVHVPAAWMAMMIYASMVGSACAGLYWRHVVAELYAKAAAPVGAAFTLICLTTGSLWGKPMWGTWWVWDARLTSVLILFFLYLGYMALINAFDDEQKGGDAGAFLLIAGGINLPIIKFSVEWWNTLHQPASLIRTGGSAIDKAMLWPLLTMALGFLAFATAIVMLRLKTEIALRAQRARAQRGG